MKKISLTLFWLSLALSVVSITACNTLGMLGAEKVKPEEVYGSWLYQRENGSGIFFTLNENGTYYYEEFGTREQPVFKKSGKYTLSGNSLHFKDLNEDEIVDEYFGPSRSENVNISFVTDRISGERKLRMVTSVARSYDMIRVDSERMPISSSSASETAISLSSTSEDAKVAVPVNLNGVWSSDDGTTLVINSEDVTVILDSESEDGKIVGISGNEMSLSFEDSELKDLKSVVFYAMGNRLTVIIPEENSATLVFTKTN